MEHTLVSPWWFQTLAAAGDWDHPGSAAKTGCLYLWWSASAGKGNTGRISFSAQLQVWFHESYGCCTGRSDLPPLDRSETEQYIASHMDYSGCTQKVFTAKALDEIYKASAGIPRMVNRICEKALMYAFQNQKRLIDDYMIKFIIEHEMLGTIPA